MLCLKEPTLTVSCPTTASDVKVGCPDIHLNLLLRQNSQELHDYNKLGLRKHIPKLFWPFEQMSEAVVFLQRTASLKTWQK